MRLVAALLVSLLAGCVSGPDYDGGPRSDEPYGVLAPGADVTVWKVDGKPTASRAFAIMVAPGRRKVLVRVEHSIESESATPYDMLTIGLEVKAGVRYELERTPSPDPPYEVIVRERPGG